MNYAGLTLDRYKQEKKEMVAIIIKEIQPDYLNLGSEPDTEYILTGLKEFNSPEKYADLINHVLEGLDRGNTKIGAGVGTWGIPAYAESIAKNTDVDVITIYVYPVFGKCLDNIDTISNIAHRYKKGVIMDEAWLYKTDVAAYQDIASNTKIFGLDAFSFWAPLDQQFLATMVKSARQNNIEYVSPFWSTYLFRYLDLLPSTEGMSYRERVQAVNRVASGNIIAGRYTTPGEFFKQLIHENT